MMLWMRLLVLDLRRLLCSWDGWHWDDPHSKQGVAEGGVQVVNHVLAPVQQA
jgi:hypothetical protein